MCCVVEDVCGNRGLSATRLGGMFKNSVRKSGMQVISLTASYKLRTVDSLKLMGAGVSMQGRDHLDPSQAALRDKTSPNTTNNWLDVPHLAKTFIYSRNLLLTLKCTTSQDLNTKGYYSNKINCATTLANTIYDDK